jgi:uncharacterized membrane protein YhaH (DUF805 family)
MFLLFNFLILIGIMIVELSILEMNLGFSTIIPVDGGGQGVLNFTYFIGMIIPTFAVCVRRLHDTGKSGWLMLIPFVNLILFCIKGDKGFNKYGENPDNVSNVTIIKNVEKKPLLETIKLKLLK